MQSLIGSVCDLKPADRRIIDQEHARLEELVKNLHETCCEIESTSGCDGCAKDKFASCQGRLSSFFYNFMDLVAEHFENEERILCGSMRIPNDEYLLRHKAAHAKLMQDLASMMQKSSQLNKKGNPADAIRQLLHWISDTFEEHAHDYDAIYLAEAKAE